MIEFEIDNQPITAEAGTMVIQAADAAGIYIPRFCYHKNLSIAANCRMCLVEVEKSAKPLPACATPVAQGMKVFTRSSSALDAQKSVMEFLLINHPLDCPICDQGGECELQDLSLGYGDDISRYHEGKRSVADENLGPLIATDMTRCIQCTRCVRFGVEVAGLPELGTIDRGENLKIQSCVNQAMQSELSGNIIDLCPVGALTSKPFRFKARAWELTQHPSIAAHDCVGSNLFVHTRGYEYNDYANVMRVVPRENNAINETWVSDRDRFSYEAIHSSDRLLTPKIKREGAWIDVDWSTALHVIVEKWRAIIDKNGGEQIAALASPSSTVEEFFLLQKLLRSLGSHNLDHRIRQLDFSQQANYPSHPQLGLSFSEIEACDTIFLVGSDIRREQPLACHRVRKASLKGASVLSLNPLDYEVNFELAQNSVVPSNHMPRVLAGILKQLTSKESIDPLLEEITPTKEEIRLAKLLSKAKTGLLLLGVHAINHREATNIRALAEKIAEVTGMTLGCLSEGSNAAGAWLAGMLPHRGPGGASIGKPGFDAADMFAQQLKSYLLLNIEPELDCAASAEAMSALSAAEFVVVMTPFITQAQEQYADVLLPVAPLYENMGTYINADNEWQSFESVTRPLGEAKPSWKVLRVLGNLFALEGFDYVSGAEILQEVRAAISSIPKTTSALSLVDNLENEVEDLLQLSEWPMYQVDNMVRRAASLQAWSQDESNVAIRINSKVAQIYDIQSGEVITIIQDEMVMDLQVIIDDRIAGNYVVIPVGIQATAGFGRNQAPIKLMRGREN